MTEASGSAAPRFDVKRAKRLRNTFAVIWLVVTAVVAPISPTFALGSAVGWSLAGLTATAFVAQLEGEKRV